MTSSRNSAVSLKIKPVSMVRIVTSLVILEIMSTRAIPSPPPKEAERASPGPYVSTAHSMISRGSAPSRCPATRSSASGVGKIMFSRCERRASGIACSSNGIVWLRMGLDQARPLHRAPEQGAKNRSPAARPRVPCNSMGRIVSTRTLLVNITPTIFVGINEIARSSGLLNIFGYFLRGRSGLQGGVLPRLPNGDAGIRIAPGGQLIGSRAVGAEPTGHRRASRQVVKPGYATALERDRREPELARPAARAPQLRAVGPHSGPDPGARPIHQPRPIGRGPSPAA